MGPESPLDKSELSLMGAALKARGEFSCKHSIKQQWRETEFADTDSPRVSFLWGKEQRPWSGTARHCVDLNQPGLSGDGCWEIATRVVSTSPHSMVLLWLLGLFVLDSLRHLNQNWQTMFRNYHLFVFLLGEKKDVCIHWPLSKPRHKDRLRNIYYFLLFNSVA